MPAKRRWPPYPNKRAGGLPTGRAEISMNPDLRYDIACTPSPSKNKGQEEKDNKYKKQDLGHIGSACGDAKETK
jgi:hypothetical protein